MGAAQNVCWCDGLRGEVDQGDPSSKAVEEMVVETMVAEAITCCH